MSGLGFQISERKGFQITFENGWTVSVQFGRGNYCSNRDYLPEGGTTFDAYEGAVPKSPTAELAAWDAAGNWHHFEHDDVEGWQTPAQVLAFLNKIAALPRPEIAGAPE